MFELHITCSKDIDKLSIDFSDGTTVIQEKPVKEVTENKKHNSIKQIKKESYLDTDVDFESVSQEIIQKPTIIESERPIKVATELQNFNF